MSILPGEVELVAEFSRHLGPKCETAGLRIQFHYNQEPGIHFKAQPRAEYRASIIRGLQEGLAMRFPDFPNSGSVWVTEVMEHEIDSSSNAFYKAARLVIEQVYLLASLGPTGDSTGSARRTGHSG